MVFSCGDRRSCYAEKVPNFMHFSLFPRRENPSAFFYKSLPSERGPHDLAVMTEAPLPLSQSVS